MENQRQLEDLFNKFLANQCTKEEISYLLEHFKLPDDEVELRSFILKQFEASPEIGALNNTRVEEAVEEVHYNLLSEIGENTDQRVAPFKGRTWFRYAIAGVVLIACSLGIYFYGQLNNRPQQYTSKPVKQSIEQDLPPGANKAVLTLADGSRIVLDDAGKGVLANQSGISIRKTADGQIIYDIAVSADQNPTSEIAYNSIETPRGGQYQINLADGSKVWLNASSSLKFPIHFSGRTRAVELKGEAYFEIAKNKNMPFHVAVNTMNIEVLGTHFNVMAYDDEKDISTTLLEGAVKVSNSSGNTLLKPGQQARLRRSSGMMKVMEVDLEEAIAWKNGYFLFNSENFQSIMRKVSRWYNVKIEYRTDMNNKDFSGSISRFENVSEVLKMLELTGAVHFQIVPENSEDKERRILVMP